MLVEHQASLSEKNPEGRNAIHLAALNGHCTVLKYATRKILFLIGKHTSHPFRYLLAQKGADIDAPEQAKTKYTALHLAAEANQGDACTVLLKAGANPNAQNDKGDTPLTTALVQKSGAAKSVTALVEGGASVYVKNKADLAPWEVAKKKDLCYSATTRNAFMVRFTWLFFCSCRFNTWPLFFSSTFGEHVSFFAGHVNFICFRLTKYRKHVMLLTIVSSKSQRR